MAWYYIDQNNSGGSFNYDKKSGVSVNVYIEADSHFEANNRARQIGIYFDDTYAVDCPCCGPRWCPVSEHDRINGNPPEKDAPLYRDTQNYVLKWMKDGEYETFVHPKDAPFYGAHIEIIDTAVYGGVYGYGLQISVTGDVGEIFPVSSRGCDETGNKFAPINGKDGAEETPFGFVDSTPFGFDYWFRTEADAINFRERMLKELSGIDIKNITRNTAETVYDQMGGD